MALPNKTMKKFISSVALSLVALAAFAQDHRSQSFLNQTSLQVSNVAAISNLVMFPGMTNIFGTQWTNNAGTRTGVTAAGNTTQLLKDVNLWVARDGEFILSQISSIPGTQTNYQYITAATLSGKILGGAAANSSVTFVFTPVWHDDPPITIGTNTAPVTPFIATTHDWSVAVTAASGVVTFATNAPTYMWAGAKKLRVRSIVNSDTDFTGNVWVQDLTLNGFIP